jgi:hypothetical protein
MVYYIKQQTLPNSKQSAEVCDATGLNSNTTAGYKI